MRPDMCVPCGEGIINIRVGAIILKDGRFLMVRNDQSDYYYSVGGRIQFGETAEEAVAREVYEETGCRLETDRLGFVLENYFISDNPSRLGLEYYELAFFFYMKTPADFEPAAKAFVEGDHREYLEWVSPDERRTIFPEFFRTELDPASEGVRHIVYDDRFYVRKMTPADFQPLHALLSDPEVMKYLEPPFTEEQTEAFLRTQGLADEPCILAAEDPKHQFIGYVIFHDYDATSKEIGWVLRKEAWGRHAASHLTKLLVGMAFQEGRDAVIECVPEHLASRKIAEENGFTETGTRDGLVVYRRACPL